METRAAENELNKMIIPKMKKDQDDNQNEEDQLIKKDNKERNGMQKALSMEEEIEKQDKDIDFLANHVQMIGNLSKQIHSTLIIQAT